MMHFAIINSRFKKERMYVMASKPKTLPYRVILEDTQAMPREVWLKHRKPAVCASDYPAIVGLCAFRTAVDIYEDKIDPENVQTEITLADKYRFDIGHALESVMHEAIAAEIGAVPVRDKRMTESTLYPYMRVDIDGLFLLQEDCVVCGHPLKKGEVVLYEGKTTGYSKFLEYRETPSPAHVAQCKFGMLVRGLSHCILGIGCGGNQLHNDLVYHICTLTEEDRETIPLVVRTFWEENVLRRTPPTEALGFYASNFKKALIAYYGKTAAEDGKTLCLPTHTAEILKRTLVVREELSRLMAEQRAKERERDAIEAPLIALLGSEYQEGVLESVYLTYKAGFRVSKRETVTAENMEKLREELPALHQQLVTAGIITQTVSRTFHVCSKRKKAKTKGGKTQ